ncbi:hypothetical protein BKA62DRAFT_657740 [Auriculariales sp. MPI-PUGE-AT-0066]|nr:hypothetical protein BKA62DRAFT_657740 [Auriculariales sp. MPI-PUGE-AT-0066]
MVTKATDDALLLIFDNFSGPARISWPDDQYDDIRAGAPFQLASVCRRWRELALETSTLWTYFGFPLRHNLHGPHLIRLQDLILRSGQAPIDVLFTYRLEGSADDGDELPASARILDSLLALVSRWRSARVCMPDSLITSYLQHNLAQEAPILEQLYLTSYASVLEIPSAPFLARLCLDTFKKGDLQCSSALPNLRSLIVFSADGIVTELMCKTYAHQLVDLCISDDLWNEGFGPVDFACLRKLSLDDASYLSRVRAAGLHTLAVNTGMLKTQTAPSLSQFMSLDHLILHGRMRDGSLTVIQNFSTISRLSFAVPAEISSTILSRHGYAIANRFFEDFSTSSACPQLAHISFSPDADQLDFVELDAFVRSRTVQLDTVSQGELRSQVNPRRLCSVVVDCEKLVPDGFHDKIHQYLNPSGVKSDTVPAASIRE